MSNRRRNVRQVPDVFPHSPKKVGPPLDPLAMTGLEVLLGLVPAKQYSTGHLLECAYALKRDVTSLCERNSVPYPFVEGLEEVPPDPSTQRIIQPTQPSPVYHQPSPVYHQPSPAHSHTSSEGMRLQHSISWKKKVREREEHNSNNQVHSSTIHNSSTRTHNSVHENSRERSNSRDRSINSCNRREGANDFYRLNSNNHNSSEQSDYLKDRMNSNHNRSEQSDYLKDRMNSNHNSLSAYDSEMYNSSKWQRFEESIRPKGERSLLKVNNTGSQNGQGKSLLKSNRDPSDQNVQSDFKTVFNKSNNNDAYMKMLRHSQMTFDIHSGSQTLSFSSQSDSQTLSFSSQSHSQTLSFSSQSDSQTVKRTGSHHRIQGTSDTRSQKRDSSVQRSYSCDRRTLIKALPQIE